MKNKLLKTCFIFILLLTTVFSVQTVTFADNTTSSNNSITTERTYQTKTPMGKKQIAYKFLLAMVGVVTSSVVIFVLLSLYNRLFYPKELAEKSENVDFDYKTPTNMKEALTIFLKKTK